MLALIARLVISFSVLNTEMLNPKAEKIIAAFVTNFCIASIDFPAVFCLKNTNKLLIIFVLLFKIKLFDFCIRSKVIFKFNLIQYIWETVS